MQESPVAARDTLSHAVCSTCTGRDVPSSSSTAHPAKTAYQLMELS